MKTGREAAVHPGDVLVTLLEQGRLLVIQVARLVLTREGYRVIEATIAQEAFSVP
jgi:hypothetical protein